MNGRDENEIAVVKLILPEQSLHYRDEIEIVVTLIIILGRRRNENESGLETSKPKYIQTIMHYLIRLLQVTAFYHAVLQIQQRLSQPH